MRKTLLSLAALAAIAGPWSANASSLSYSLSVTDVDAPNEFSFVFSTPIVVIPGPAAFTFSGSFELTDGSTDGVSASLGGLPEFWQIAVGFPTTVVDDVGGTSALVGPGPHLFSASGIVDCSTIGGCDGISIAVSFTGSGRGDTYFSTGIFTLEPVAAVPEPGMLALLGFALAGLGLSRRSRGR